MGFRGTQEEEQHRCARDVKGNCEQALALRPGKRCPLLQKMGSIGMPQGMNGCAFVDAGFFQGLLEGDLHRCFGHGFLGFSCWSSEAFCVRLI